MRIPAPCRQRGVALLLFVFLAMIVGTSVLLSAWNSSRGRQQQERATLLALQQAKDAVLGWSASHASRPGMLPCPEDTSAIGTANEGQASGSCTAATPRIGRLPWRTLKVDNLQDGNGEQLWYVLSPGFRTSPINTGSPAQLQVDGTASAAVAIIIAPGPPLAGQSRSVPSAASPPQPANYLDLANGAGAVFVSSGPADTFNDRLVVITQAELANALTRRVLGEIAGATTTNGLLRYYNDNSQFPWADTTGDGTADVSQSTGALPYGSLYFDTATGTWLANNGWFPLVSYSRLSASSAQIALGSRTMKVAP